MTIPETREIALIEMPAKRNKHLTHYKPWTYYGPSVNTACIVLSRVPHCRRELVNNAESKASPMRLFLL